MLRHTGDKHDCRSDGVLRVGVAATAMPAVGAVSAMLQHELEQNDAVLAPVVVHAVPERKRDHHFVAVGFYARV